MSLKLMGPVMIQILLIAGLALVVAISVAAIIAPERPSLAEVRSRLAGV